jgi:phosphoglycolate phosphatase-like HAD superfamily hydrolase
MKTQLVICNLFGTLIQDKGRRISVLKSTLQSVEIEASDWELTLVQSLSFQTALDILLQRYWKNESQIEANLPHLANYANGMFFSNLKNEQTFELRDGVLSTLRDLQSSHIKWCADCELPPDTADWIQDKWNINYPSIPLQFLSSLHDSPRPKPFPDALLASIRYFNIQDLESVARIGSSKQDLLQANHARCGKIIGLASPYCSQEELQSYPHTHLINAFSESYSILTETPRLLNYHKNNFRKKR